MAVQTAVDVLARMLEGFETGDRSVHHVGATTTGGDGDTLHVDMEVPVPLCPGGDRAVAGAPEGAALSEDGTLAVRFPADGAAAFPSPPDADVSMAPQSARVHDGEILLSLEVTITPTDGAESAGPTGETTENDGTGSATGQHDDRGSGASTRPAGGVTRSEPDEDAGSGDDIEAARNEAVPPYEDTEYLRALYTTYDTFSEMRDVIEMDVSTETVRRYMIDAGVHDPSSYETAARTAAGSVTGGEPPSDASSAEQPSDRGAAIPDEQLVTDGIGLPDDLSLEDVLDAVVESSTVYEVTRMLELEQRRTREILEHLDLLELVMHRVSDDRTREVTYEEVADRLRRVAATA